jgi:putative endonuclease
MAAPSRDDARTPPEPPAEFGRWSFWRRWFGQRSERAAAKFLRKLGYRILAANVADTEGEIDLLALDGGTLVVVEVRSRSVDDPGVAAAPGDARYDRPVRRAGDRLAARCPRTHGPSHPSCLRGDRPVPDVQLTMDLDLFDALCMATVLLVVLAGLVLARWSRTRLR